MSNNVRVSTEDGNCILGLPQRISSDNVSEIFGYIYDALEEQGRKDFLMDAGEMRYISSAGLRELITLTRNGYDFQIINVSPEIYEIFDITGMTAMIAIKGKE